MLLFLGIFPTTVPGRRCSRTQTFRFCNISGPNIWFLGRHTVGFFLSPARYCRPFHFQDIWVQWVDIADQNFRGSHLMLAASKLEEDQKESKVLISIATHPVSLSCEIKVHRGKRFYVICFYSSFFVLCSFTFSATKQRITLAGVFLYFSIFLALFEFLFLKICLSSFPFVIINNFILQFGYWENLQFEKAQGGLNWGIVRYVSSFPTNKWCQ